MNWEAFFLENLALIDGVSRSVCRKYGLIGAEADDFVASVHLKLIENGYHVLREWKRDSLLSTYLNSVIRRHYIDQRIREQGKWRPSMRARRGGDAAILLERLITFDGVSLPEAAARVRQHFPKLDARAVEALTGSIVVRPPRRTTTVDVKEIAEPVARGTADDKVLAREREASAVRTNEVVNRELGGLPAEDRLIMKLHHIDALQISVIARMLQLDQKDLYRRIDRLRARMRSALLAAGVAMTDIGDMLTNGADALRFRFDDDEDPG